MVKKYDNFVRTLGWQMRTKCCITVCTGPLGPTGIEKACHDPAERSSQLSHDKLLRSGFTGTSRLSGVLFVEWSRLSTVVGSVACVHHKRFECQSQGQMSTNLINFYELVRKLWADCNAGMIHANTEREQHSVRERASHVR